MGNCCSDNVRYFQEYVEPGFDVEYLVLVTSQFGDRLVNVLAFGKERGRNYPSDADLLKEIEEQRAREMEKARQQEPRSPDGKAPSPPPQPPSPAPVP